MKHNKFLPFTGPMLAIVCLISYAAEAQIRIPGTATANTESRSVVGHNPSTFAFPLIAAGSLQKGREPATRSTPAPTAPNVRDKSGATGIEPSLFKGLELRNTAPAKSSGRVVDIAVDPNNRNIRYVATASGNVWKTINAGTTWQPIFENYGSYSTGTIEIDPNQSNVIWLGTGENNAQRSVGFGDGVYKSTNAGKTWRNMGLKTSEHIGKIIIDPRDSNVVFVASQGSVWAPGGERGLYKTTDGGESWTRILHISEDTGISDIIFDPRNPDIMLVSSYQRRRHFGILVGGGPDGGVWKSVDGGADWSKVGGGFPQGDLGRIGLAISPQKPDVVYAYVAGTDETGGFYRSENLGDNWQKTNNFKTMDAQYYMEIFPDPHQFDRLMIVDVHIHVSEDGGRTFNRMNSRGKHVDNHEIEFDPRDPDYLLVGCDGGIYESWDRGDSWRFTENLPIVQFYRVGIDNALPFYNVYGGTQDNATLGGPSRTVYFDGIRNYDWFITQGGDGFQTRVDPDNPNIVYSESQYAGIVRYDRQSGDRVSIRPQPGQGEPPLRWNWDAPLLISPHNGKRLYFAANKVFRSDNRGSSWKAISPDLTRQQDRNRMKVMGRVWGVDSVFKNVWTSPLGTIVALDESPDVEGLLYAGTDDGLIQVTEDGGKSWQKRDIPNLPSTAYTSDVHASRTDADTVFAVFNNHKYGDYKPYIYKSTNRGKSWTSISSNITSPEFAWTLMQDHIQPDLLFVGTEFGLWFTVDGGNQWIKFESGIPTIPIRDLEIQQRENDLVAASFGRGMFFLDDYALLREINKQNLAKEHFLFAVKDPLLYRPHNPESRDLGSTFFTSPNPPFGAVISYYNKTSTKTLGAKRREAERARAQKNEPIYYPDWEDLHAENRESRPVMVFSIRDADGSLVRRLTGPVSKGIHRIAWDLRSRDEGQGRRGGLYVLPGSYTVTMARVVNGIWEDLEGSQEFEVVPLDNTSLPLAGKETLKAFQTKVLSLRTAIGRAGTVIQTAVEDMKRIQKLAMNDASDGRDIYSSAHKLQNQLQDLDLELNGDQYAVSKMELIAPSPSQRINSIYYGFLSSRGEPTGTNKESYAVAASDFKAILSKLSALLDADIKALEQRLKDEGIAFHPGDRRIIWQE